MQKVAKRVRPFNPSMLSPFPARSRSAVNSYYDVHPLYSWLVGFAFRAIASPICNATVKKQPFFGLIPAYFGLIPYQYPISKSGG
jgi:hypothetical protein